MSEAAGAVVAERGCGQYLSFSLLGENYAVDILRVQEIRGWDRVTPLPGTPEWVKGVMNLRGAVVPIVDLRTRFEMPPLPISATTVVVILKVLGEDRERVIGVLVDSVNDVHDVDAGQLRAPPRIGTRLGVDVVRNLAAVDGKMLILLDVDRLLDLSAG